jgi:hypothetical protein
MAAAQIQLSSSGLMVITTERLEVVNFTMAIAHNGICKLQHRTFYIKRYKHGGYGNFDIILD